MLIIIRKAFTITQGRDSTRIYDISVLNTCQSILKAFSNIRIGRNIYSRPLGSIEDIISMESPKILRWFEL
jgi:hypothetical protein